MEYDVRLEDVADSRPIAVVRRQASISQLPKVIPDSCGTVWNVIRAQQITGAGRHVAIYLDEQINLEIGVELNAPFAGFGEVVSSEIPDGRIATTTHFGPYGLLHQAHQAIRQWCASHGHALAGPNWEIYGHWVDEWNNNPSRIRTDVFYLLTTGDNQQFQNE
jgi:effector-binding domain-containing protein